MDRSGGGLLTSAGVEHDRAVEVAARLRGWWPARPLLGVVLGSGLGAYAERLAQSTSFAYGELPHFSQPRVAGHPGRLWLGVLDSVALCILQGRVHLYEGHSPAQVVFGVRVLHALGVKGVLLTNAAGGIRTDLGPGATMCIADHLNLTGHNPLVGENDDRLGPRFPDLTAAYDSGLVAAMFAAAKGADMPLATGVYAQVLGPSFETPAEVRMLRTLGADAVGMSTAIEAIAARQLGLRVAGLSFISNAAAGLGEAPLDHEEVTARVQAGVGPFSDLLDRFIPLAAQALSA